jgi:hypothetical protein
VERRNDVELRHGPPQGAGPNYSCTTNPITRLTDVSVDEGKTAIKTAIDAMRANGGTNVPEGLAWGWRALSHGEPLTEGRPDNERGNDKVVIVLTDGENTYYTPGSLGFSDPADTKSIYSSYGYLKPGYNGTGVGRLFMGTSAGQFDYSNTNYTTALNQHMDAVCANAKAANVIVMTVALDLSSTNAAQKKQIEALERCASESRFRKDPANPAKPAKLFYNATGGDLDEKFKAIADELSNLRIVGSANRDHLAVEMPGGVAEYRHHDRQSGQERQRANEQGRGHDQPPGGHRHGICKNRAGGGLDRGHRADVAVEQQREGDDGRRQHQQREHEAQGVADEDQRPAGGRRQHVAQEHAYRARRVGPEQRDVERLGDEQPHQEKGEKQRSQRQDRRDRRREAYRQRMAPGGIEAGLAAAAYLVEADRGERPEQREPRNQREQERQRVRA